MQAIPSTTKLTTSAAVSVRGDVSPARGWLPLPFSLPSTAYRDPKGRQKVVRYWLMEPLGGEFEPNHEVDEMRWLPAAEAADLLTYEHDRELLREVTG